MRNERYIAAILISCILFYVSYPDSIFASDSKPTISLKTWYAFTPYEDYSYCSWWGEHEWQVTNAGNKVTVQELQRIRKQPELPFPFKMGQASDGLAGDVSIHRVTNGYLVGFDAGEFGGGIWWFSKDGETRKHLVEDNLLSFHEIGIGVIGLAGLAHLTISEGQVLLFKDNKGSWSGNRLISLDGAPMSSYQDKSGNVFVVTTGSLWLIDSKGSSKIIHKQDAEWVYPNSIIVTDERVVYIGARNAIIRLTLSSGNYKEEWMIPKKCKMILKDRIRAICNCVEFE